MYTVQEIIQFIEQQTLCENIQADDDLLEDHGIYGDDFYDLIEAYAKQYAVDCSSFIWYFHNGEEGLGFPGSLLFKPPNKRVDYIPITPEILTNFANKGKWDIKYPPHEIPQQRNDVVFNQIFFIIIGFLIACIILAKLVKAYG